MSEQGKVYLVGAGPGDPGLITAKGLQCLQEAQVVLYDRLVDQRLLGEASPDAETLDVGKARGFHREPQEGINQLMVEKALEGKMVVRLKGGDPFIFGRGGEEAEALAKAGVPFEIVPGVTSAIAAPAYAGIPLTHRRVSSSVTIVSGSEDPTKGESSVDWKRLAGSNGTNCRAHGLGDTARHCRSAYAARYGRFYSGSPGAVGHRTAPEDSRRLPGRHR